MRRGFQGATVLLPLEVPTALSELPLRGSEALDPGATPSRS
jgi:hypothetical protein